MSNRSPHNWKQLLAETFQDLDSFSFDFNVIRKPYDYQVAVGNEGHNSLAGNVNRDHFWGLAGRDQLYGASEDDVLYGDQDHDTLSGGDGGDLLYGGSGDDYLFGGDGADALRGGMGDDYLDEGPGHSGLEGGMGNDTLVGGEGPDAFIVDPMSGDDVIRDFTAGPGMFDHLALRDLRWEDLSFTDTTAGVLVSWEGGSVLLEGVAQSQLAQDDFMFAEQPDLPPASRDATGPTEERASPSIEDPSMSESALPGMRFDYIADVVLRHNDLRVTFEGEEAYQVIVGEKRSDNLIGGETWDHIFGRNGNDTLRGADGDDVLYGNAGRDLLYGGNGSDRLDGGLGRDTLVGGAMADELLGADGDDVIDAGAGHDMIEGGRGNDIIVGGTGADAFIVAPNSGFDVIRDMEVRGLAQGAFDHLALRDIEPGDVEVVDYAAGAFVWWDTDEDADAEGGVLLQGVFKDDLRQSDFMFIGEPGFVDGISDAGSDWVFTS